jgi:hypothetical protein
MTATIAAAEWLEFVKGEYLDAFIRDGGSSIKFAVALDDSAKAAVTEGIARSAETAGYIVARVSAEDTKIHMMDHLFFRVAEQMPWQDLTQRAVNRLVAEHGYAQALTTGATGEFVERLATANQMQPDGIRLAIRPKIMQGVFKNRKLARDFRVAASQLCLAELAGGADGEITTVAITDWLTGRNKAVAAVRPYQIFTRIHRTNARHLFASLLRWVRFAGSAGVVILIDMARVALPSNPRDGSVFYTKAAMFDAYEVLRQFIDATDEMKGLLMVLTPAVEFLDPEPTGRGLAAYDALKFRVFDEVRDQRLVNPMTALVRIAASGGGA